MNYDPDYYEPAEDAHLESAYEDRFGVNEVDTYYSEYDELDPDDEDSLAFEVADEGPEPFDDEGYMADRQADRYARQFNIDY